MTKQLVILAKYNNKNPYLLYAIIIFKSTKLRNIPNFLKN